MAEQEEVIPRNGTGMVYPRHEGAGEIASERRDSVLSRSARDFERQWIAGIQWLLDSNSKLKKFYDGIHERIMSGELPTKNYQIQVTIDDKTCPQCSTINNFESNDLASLLDLLRHCERRARTNGKERCPAKVVSNRFTLES